MTSADVSAGGVTWSSSDSDVASADTNGEVTAGSKEGTAVITATASDVQQELAP